METLYSSLCPFDLPAQVSNAYSAKESARACHKTLQYFLAVQQIGMCAFCLFRTYFHEGANHMEKKTITLSNVALVQFGYQADRAAAKVVRKGSVPHGLAGNKSPASPPLLPTSLTGI